MITAYKRWSEEDVQTFKELYIEGRENNVPHKVLWKQIARVLGRKPSEVQRKIIQLYKVDEDLQKYKQSQWTKETILEQLKELYLSGHPFNKNHLPKTLSFIIMKVVPPACPEHRRYFESFDHALAEAVLLVGYERKEDGSLDYYSPITSMEEALDCIRRTHKKRHEWTLEEITLLLQKLHQLDYPLTLNFLAKMYDLYGPQLQLNRKLESLRDVMSKFQDISFADLVCSVAPEYIDYYNEDKTRLKFSTEELRVKKFFDRFKIPYLIPRLSDRIQTHIVDYPNVVPDFFITNEAGDVRAVVEVFGSIGDRTNNDISDRYQNRTKAKNQFYDSLKAKNIDYVAIYNNNGQCDLSDEILMDKFAPYIHIKKASKEETLMMVQYNIEQDKRLPQKQKNKDVKSFEPSKQDF